MSILTDFKNFISKGNVLGLGIAVIMGDAFNKIISSVTVSYTHLRAHETRRHRV
ncbi:MscL family protein, partial [Zymomonas mobilis]|uniref:MscL family protein n=1 Tax=Zymomonas mobilis TaxID=542 RepID=UPI00242CA0FD